MGEETSDRSRDAPLGLAFAGDALEVAFAMKPNPTELDAAINPEATGRTQRGVESHRRLFCPRYDDCLDEAVAKGWNSWTCARCPLIDSSPKVEGDLEGYATQRRWA